MTMSFAIAMNTSPPWLDVAISGLPAGTASLSVTRVWASTSAPVREAATVAGSTGRFVDYDAPVGWPVSYRVDAYSAGGALLESGTTSARAVATPFDAATAGWAASSAAASLTIDSTTSLAGRTGAGAAALACVTAGGTLLYVYNTSPILLPTPSVTVAATAWLGDPADSAQLGIRWALPGGTFAYTYGDQVKAASGTRLTLTAPVPAGATAMQVRLQHRSPTALVVGETSWWDSVTVDMAPSSGDWSATSVPHVIPAPDRGMVWVSDPLAPRGALLLPTIIGTDAERSYSAPVRAITLLADSLPLVSSDVRSEAEAWPIALGTRTDAEAEALLACLRAGSTILLRADRATLRHPTGLVFVGAPTVKRILYDGAEHSDWYATTFQARGPAIPSALYPKTFADVAALGGTFADRKAANAGKTFLQESRG